MGYGKGETHSGGACPQRAAGLGCDKPPVSPVPVSRSWPPAPTLMDREEVADAMAGPVAVVEPHVPERPAGKGLHVSPWRMRTWDGAGEQ